MTNKKKEFTISASFFTVIMLLINLIPFTQGYSIAPDFIISMATVTTFNIISPLFLAMVSKNKKPSKITVWINTILVVVFSSMVLINRYTPLSFGTSPEVSIWIIYAGSILAVIANSIMYLIRNNPVKK